MPEQRNSTTQPFGPGEALPKEEVARLMEEADAHNPIGTEGKPNERDSTLITGLKAAAEAGKEEAEREIIEKDAGLLAKLIHKLTNK